MFRRTPLTESLDFLGSHFPKWHPWPPWQFWEFPEILKVAHHGSRTSSSAKFLSAVRPEVALISCGIDNKFKHPSPEVVLRYEAQQIRVERTDLAGAIRIDVWDGNYRITPFLARTQTADARDSAHPPLF